VRRRAARPARRSLAAILVALAAAAAPAAAHAGVYHVYLGEGGAGCDASSYFAGGVEGFAVCSGELPAWWTGGNNGWDLYVNSVRQSVRSGATGHWQISAPSGLEIQSADLSGLELSGLSNSEYGWRASAFWPGSATSLVNGMTDSDTSVNGGYVGWQLYCRASSCETSKSPQVDVSDVELTVSEASGPRMIALGQDNLLYQGNRWVWNPAGDPWSIAFTASDPSGVCSMSATVGSVVTSGPASPKTTSSFQQCPSPSTWSQSDGAQVDTSEEVPSSGSLPLTLQSTNAAGVTSAASVDLEVDNIQPTVTLTTPNDSNPSVWIGHAVSVVAQATTGPSGLSSLTCSVDGGSPQPYPAGGLIVNGNGVHTVSCTAASGAIDPQGQHDTGSATLQIKIDEAPPSVQIDPPDPLDPDRVLVEASDDESGIVGGAIQLSRTGSGRWATLPSSYANGELTATIDDAGRSGPYTLRAIACDAVGNCGLATEALRLPLRTPARSEVGFTRISAPATVVATHLRVDYRLRRVRLDGRTLTIEVGGHERTVRIRIARNRACARRMIRTGARRRQEVEVCRRLRVRLLHARRVPFGRSVRVAGILVTATGNPIAHARVLIETAPNNRLERFRRVTSAITNAIGAWAARLPPGPSRIIHVVYRGSETDLPATGSAALTVPARIDITLAPRRLTWSGILTIRGALKGGYVPPDGVAMRLLIWLPGRARPYSPVPFRTTGAGTFTLHWSFISGRGIEWIPFSVATTATESDYPFAASDSRKAYARFGP
jgi:hypothetical protein